MSNATNYYIAGHRGTGKSTAARRAAEHLGCTVVDLDDVIERREGRTCAEIVAEDESHFRRLERRYRMKALEEAPSDAPTIVSLGAGYQPLPDDGVVVWLHRDGWQETARRERRRLQPGRPFDAEVRWMVEHREPRWERASHLRLDMPRGRGPERVGRDLATHLSWLESMSESRIMQKTWFVAGGPSQLDAAEQHVEHLGGIGVEVRSDLLEAEDAVSVDAPRLASLRTPDLDWLNTVLEAGVAVLDLDVAFVESVLESGVLADHSPCPLLLSTHPSGPASASPNRFAGLQRVLSRHHPDWAETVAVKYAPSLDGPDECREAFEVRRQLHERFERVTCLIQERRWAWTRPVMAPRNATNYLPVGLGPQRREFTEASLDVPWDLQAWLPHLAPPAPTTFDGLIGAPVEPSQGDVWHRRRADGERSYLKIPAVESDDGALDELLELTESLPIRGLSVTSPLKREVAALDRVANPEELEAGNTLRRRRPREKSEATWELTDTDARGMAASLEFVEQKGFGPGSIALIGTGGVAPALRRAIEASSWHLAHHARGREGWGDDTPDDATMVVNAIGDRDNAYDAPPDCEVWLDLHYTDVRPPPEDVRLHLNGDRFFDAQAEAQRQFWAEADVDPTDSFDST